MNMYSNNFTLQEQNGDNRMAVGLLWFSVFYHQAFYETFAGDIGNLGNLD